MLRGRVEDLTRQNAALRSERLRTDEDVSVSRATGQSSSKPTSPAKVSNERIVGIVQRLSQKEKEVTRLMGEIERLKKQTVHREVSAAKLKEFPLKQVRDRMTGPRERVTRLELAHSTQKLRSLSSKLTNWKAHFLRVSEG